MRKDTLTTLVHDVVSTLRSNISDPNTARTSNFIYPDMFHRRATMPRITVIVRNVEMTDGNRDIDGYKYYTIYLDIDVWVGTNIVFTIDEEEYEPAKLLDYLVDKVIDVVDEASFPSFSVIQVKRMSIAELDSGIRNIIRKNISYMIEVM